MPLEPHGRAVEADAVPAAPVRGEVRAEARSFVTMIGRKRQAISPRLAPDSTSPATTIRAIIIAINVNR